MNKIILSLIVLFVALARLIPHPPNFTPIIAMGLFGGAYFKNYKLALLIPIMGMLISDFFIGFHSMMLWIYAPLVIVTFIGVWIKDKINTINLISSILLGSILFFIISNFGVWFIGGYEKNIQGIINCYIMAIPFFHNTLIGSFFYGAIMFGGYEAAKYIVKHNAPDSI